MLSHLVFILNLQCMTLQTISLPTTLTEKDAKVFFLKKHTMLKTIMINTYNLLTVSFSISKVTESKNMALCNKQCLKWPISPVLCVCVCVCVYVCV